MTNVIQFPDRQSGISEEKARDIYAKEVAQLMDVLERFAAVATVDADHTVTANILRPHARRMEYLGAALLKISHRLRGLR